MYGNGSPSPTRRSSIERLQKASRVKNSNILALEQKQEYDPTRIPQIERPLAKVQGSPFGITAGSPGPRSPDGDKSAAPMSPTKSDHSGPSTPRGPSKDQASPTKSSLSPSKFKSSFDHETGMWTADTSIADGPPSGGRSSHRHTKSVTFDAAPPQINEYEMATPDLSSIGTNSREGSYDSMEEDEEDDEDLLYDPAHMGGPEDESFDASLEDTDKTPVVGPDDWARDNSLIHHNDHDEYDGSPMPEGTPGAASSGRPSLGSLRADSVGSVTENRPLPPLPGAGHARSQSAGSVPSSPNLSQTPEKASGSHRSLPVPPPASATKSDIEDFISGKMSLEERLKLMMLSDDSSGKTAAEQQRERRLRRSSGRSRSSLSRDDTLNTDAHDSQIVHDEEEVEPREEDENLGDMSGIGDYQLPQPISRESIMKRVNGNKIMTDPESEYNFSSPPGSPLRDQHFPLDPDVPIPSTEDSLMDDEDDEDDEDGDYDDEDPVESSVIIHRVIHDDDDDDDDLDMYDSDYDDEYDDDLDGSHFQSDDDLDGSRSHYGEDDSQYTESVLREEPAEKPVEESTKEPVKESVTELSPPESDITEEVLTPRAISPLGAEDEGHLDPDLEPSMLSESAASVSDLESDATTPEVRLEPAREASEDPEEDESPRVSAEILRTKTPEKLLPKPEYDGTGWGDDSYEDRSFDDRSYDDRTGTPDSVIHNPVSEDEEETILRESPEIPERLATIKASGSKLKTRVSNTPSDIIAMREARRHVSGEIPGVPSIPSKHRGLMSRDGNDIELSNDSFLARHPSFKNRSLTLDLDMGLSLDKDFERVIETQKVAFSRPLPHPKGIYTTNHDSSSRRVSGEQSTLLNRNQLGANITSRSQRGYLMRQNTKLVSASDKDAEDPWKARSANNSPIKASRPQSWTVEPWNSQTRRSIRKGQPILSPVPPLPGQESNATALNKVVEEDYNADVAGPEAGERGRLFVKVIGVKDLDLPIPKNERSWFSLTLDNGVHCVTTAWLELARNAPIGQEFELVVPNDLEFQLTLNVKLEKPTYSNVQPAAVKMTKPKTSTFSRVFASPKKRKELELRQRAEEERFALQQKEALARQRKDAGSAYELLSPLAAEDGSFARAYISLKEHENRCFGRPYTVEVVCFNEWASEEESFASTIKSKRGNAAGILRRAPYKIGKLELQLLFVPRPKNITDDDMPKSMNSCIRELKAAEERLARNWEGVLSQQGGDCPYWRRRYFKLVGTKLTAYHEATRQPRATINLSNAKRLIDDRRTLMEKETTGKGGKRRRSAFAEDEEGYMFVEEGFRIRFNNGEVIDFYADTAEDKEGWMKALSDVIGRGDAGIEEDNSGPRSRAKWCELVFKHEEQIRRRTDSRRVHSRTRSTFN
ncbi:gtp binding bud4 [Trichoderma arundinaceum]|uniref:Gtp binding bud4 n=1 Tax=Trichoderma arundinaceum TaxID=490622 RepID=A0A395N7X5_TRIAR|nr:gtp binding bud4 [Trichoderma arundinaceum]